MRSMNRLAVPRLAVAGGVLGLVLVLPRPAPSVTVPEVRLTGIVTMGAESSGAYHGGYDWHTFPGGAWNLWVIAGNDPSGTFLNGPDGARSAVNLLLKQGKQTFTLLGSANQPDLGFNGVNLHFNGEATPRISAFGPLQASSSQDPPFRAIPATVTTLYNPGNTGPGADALQYTVPGSTNWAVRLEDFRFAGRSVYSIDRASPYQIGPDGRQDNVAKITLSLAPPDKAAPKVKVTQFLASASPSGGKWFAHCRLVGNATDAGGPLPDTRLEVKDSYGVATTSTPLVPAELTGKVSVRFDVPADVNAGKNQMREYTVDLTAQDGSGNRTVFRCDLQLTRSHPSAPKFKIRTRSAIFGVRG